MRTRLLAGLLVLAAPASALAKGGGGGAGGGTTVSGPCATFAVTNNGLSVRNFSMPDVKYNLENCAAGAEDVTLTVTEIPGFLSELCPSPVAPPQAITLAAKQKLSGTVPVFRGPCGYRGSSSADLVQSQLGWQGHNLQLTVTDDASGAVLGTAFFSWQDAPTRV